MKRTVLQRRSLACLVVASLVLGGLATPAAAHGGATAETTQESSLESAVTVTVSEDADLESLHVQQELPASMGQGMAMIGEFGPYDNLAEYIAEQSVEDDNGVNGYENATAEQRDDAYAIEITFDEIDAAEADDMNLSVADGTIRLEMTGFNELLYPNDGDGTQPPAFTEYSDYTATAEMPGTITDSNADRVEGTEATWNLHEEVPDELVVESGGSGTSGGAGDGNGDSDDSLPGFGPVVAVGGLVTALLGLIRRS